MPSIPARASLRLLRLASVGTHVTEPPEIDAIETLDDYRHVRFRDPARFDTVRTPDWAANAVRSVSEGAEIRTGTVVGSDDWRVESVRIDKHVGVDTARDEARAIVEKIEL